MKIIAPSVSLYTPFGPVTKEDGVKLIQWVEFNGRLSHRSEEAITADSYKRFIPSVVGDHGDWSITEHSSMTAIFRVNRGVTHELVRHRLFSFTQESTRFVNYAKPKWGEGLEFIMPADYGVQQDEEWHTSGDHAGQSTDGPMVNVLQDIEDTYMRLIRNGVRPQEARAVLPNATAATISVTGNLRNWRHFFLMRTSKETHPDFRQVTIPLLAEAKNVIPFLYDDIEPNQRQIDNLKKAR